MNVDGLTLKFEGKSLNVDGLTLKFEGKILNVDGLTLKFGNKKQKHNPTSVKKVNYGVNLSRNQNG